MIFIDVSKAAKKMSTQMTEYTEYAASDIRLNERQSRYLNKTEVQALVQVVKQNPKFSDTDLFEFYLSLEE